MRDKVFEDIFDLVDEFKAETIQELEEEYEEVQEELLFWLMLFSVDEKLDWVEMKQNLTDSQLNRLKRYLGDKVEDRVRIKRIDTINLILETKIKEINDLYAEKMKDFSMKVYEETYYQTTYDVQDEKKSYWVVPAVVAAEVLKKLLKPWTADGINFVDRIDIKGNQLIDTVKKEITQAILRGESPDRITSAISKRFNINVNSAKNLINTESTRVVSEASFDAMKDDMVREYEYRAILDNRTSDICRSMNGRRFKITEFEIGVTAPPLHSHCRSFIKWDTPNAGESNSNINSFMDWHEKYVQEREKE